MTNPPLPPAFQHLAGANLAAQLAEQLSLAATPIVAVLLLDAGPGEIGTLAAMQTLPFLLLAMPLGVWADRHSRRTLMLMAEALRALSLLGLVLLVASGQATITWLALLGFVGATGTVAFSVAAPAMVPTLVPQGQLAQANGRIELARSVAFAGGPALGGVLVSWAGASPAFVIAALLSVVALWALWGLHEAPRAPAPARHPLAELRDGARFVWHQRLLRPILLTAVGWNIALFVLQSAYVPYAVRVLGLDAGAVGLTLAGYGVGMVVGALGVGRLIAAMPFGLAILLGPMTSVLAALLMVATLAWPSGLLAWLAFFFFGAGPIVWTVTTMTLRQTLTAPTMLARVGAIFLTVNIGARPVGALLGGWVGAQWGEAACLWLALAGFVLQAAIISASPVRRLQSVAAAAAPVSHPRREDHADPNH